jgi:hypothetical protein
VESAYGPDCGALVNVMAIIPSALYAADFMISGTTDFRKVSAAAMPVGAFGAHGVGLPSSQRSATMYDREGVVLLFFRSVFS